MIKNLSKVTLYVDNQEDALLFWTKKIGFVLIFQQEIYPDFKWIEVAPNKLSETALVLYDKKLMNDQNPVQNTGTPSLIFSSKNIEETYIYLKSKGVKVGDLLDMPYGKIFSFYDEDSNSFLIRE